MSPDDDIRFSIGHALRQCRVHFGTMAKKHGKDTEIGIVANAVLRQLRLAGYDVVKVKPPTPAHSTHGHRVD